MRVSPLRRADRWHDSIATRLWRGLTGLLALIGLTTVLVVSTPIVSWWVRAYSGPIDKPSGDILILLSAANDDNGGI